MFSGEDHADALLEKDQTALLGILVKNPYSMDENPYSTGER